MSADQAATIPVPHPGLGFCQVAERNVAELGKWLKGDDDKTVVADAALAIRTLIAAIEVPPPHATTCAVCLQHKPTPLRRDDMGGYVCLTCIDARLSELGAAQDREPIAWLRNAQPEAEDEALVVCWQGDPGAFAVYAAQSAACQYLLDKAEALERSVASDGVKISAYLRDDIEVAIQCMRDVASGRQAPDEPIATAS